MISDAVEKRCGCPEERWTKCHPHPWYMKKMRHKGKEYEPNVTRYAAVVLGKTITTKTEAEALAVDIIRPAIRNGSYVSAKGYAPPPPPKAEPTYTGTVRALADLYGTLRIDADTSKRPNSKVNDKGILNRLCEFLGDTRVLATVVFDDLVAFRGWRGQLANSTWAKDRTLLGQFFRWATDAAHIPTDPIASASNDARKLLKRSKARQRRRRIDAATWANLLEAAKETRTHAAGVRLHAVLIALLETNCRIGELLALKWGDVHFDTLTLWIRAEEIGGAKTDRGRAVDISQFLRAELLTIQHDPAGQKLGRSKYVFGDCYGGRVKSIDKAFNTAVLRAHNLEPQWTAKGAFTPASLAQLAEIDLHVHDIRHESSCRQLESGCFDLAQIQQRLGHATLAQTGTYVHALPHSVKAAQAVYDAQRVAAAAAGPTAGANHGPRGGKTGANRKVAKASVRKARVLHLTKARAM